MVDDIGENLVGVKAVGNGGRIETRRDFKTLLQAGTLDVAVPGAEVDDVGGAPFRKYLHFQMVEIADALLDKHAFILELPGGIVTDAPVHGTKEVNIVYFFNSHAAAAGRCLNKDDRPLEALLLLELIQGTGDIFGLHFIINGLVRAGHGWYAQTPGQTLGVDFVAEFANQLPGGADKDKPPVAPPDAPGEPVVLGEKAVPRMKGRRAGLVGNSHKLIGVVIGRHAVETFFSSGFASQTHMA